MSLLNAILPILNSRTAKVVFEISANANVAGEIVVVTKPIVGPVSDTASHELKQLCAALSTPLKAIGTPETIEAELYAVVAEQAPQRNSWANRATELDAMIADAAKKDGPAKTAAPAKKPTPKAPVADESIENPLPMAGEPTTTNPLTPPPADDNLSFEL